MGLCNWLSHNLGPTRVPLSRLVPPDTSLGAFFGETREGKIVPAKVTVGLLRKTMKASGKSRFLIDGFPRNLENLTAWEKASEDGAVVVDFALFLDCPEDVRRCLWSRRERGSRCVAILPSLLFRHQSALIMMGYEKLCIISS